MEGNRQAALEAMRRLEQQLISTLWSSTPQRLKLTVMLAFDLPPVVLDTHIERELAFMLSHTIHRDALIAVMNKQLGVRLPAEFGYAPSTIAHPRSRTCAH